MTEPKTDKARIRMLEDQLRQARESRDKWQRQAESLKQQLTSVIQRYKHKIPANTGPKKIRWSLPHE